MEANAAVLGRSHHIGIAAAAGGCGRRRAAAAAAAAALHAGAARCGRAAARMDVVEAGSDEIGAARHEQPHGDGRCAHQNSPRTARAGPPRAAPATIAVLAGARRPPVTTRTAPTASAAAPSGNAIVLTVEAVLPVRAACTA